MTNCIDHGRRKATINSGYAYKKIGGRVRLLHRLVYVAAHGLNLEDITGLVVRHTCDNPRCINPEHLLIGTHADNMRDKMERGRGRWLRGEAHSGAKLTKEQVVLIRNLYIPRDREVGCRALARRFNISPNQVSLIVNGKSWQHGS